MLLNFNTVFRIIHICVRQRAIQACRGDSRRSAEGPAGSAAPTQSRDEVDGASTLTPRASSSGRNRHRTLLGHSPRRHNEEQPHQGLPPKAAQVPPRPVCPPPPRAQNRVAPAAAGRQEPTHLAQAPGHPSVATRAGLLSTRLALPRFTLLFTLKAAGTDSNAGSSLKAAGPQG